MSERIIFAGTPEFAAIILQQLLAAKYSIVAVYTQPDRPAGRGRKQHASPVKQLAQHHALPIEQPNSLRDPASQQTLAGYAADILIVAAYGQILPQAVLDIPRLGCINVHASLLPRWRGAAPIQRAILAGDSYTGISLMQMDQGLDTGAILRTATIPITPTTTGGSLHDQLADCGADLLVKTLPAIFLQCLPPVAQDATLATYAKKINKQEAWLNWQQAAISLLRQINAFNPWPVAQTLYQNQTLRIWQAELIDADLTDITPGKVYRASAAGIDVATGQGGLRLQQLQWPGRNPISARDMCNTLDLTDSQLCSPANV